MMKKLMQVLALILSISMLFTLASCKKTKPKKENTSSTQSAPADVNDGNDFVDDLIDDPLDIPVDDLPYDDTLIEDYPYDDNLDDSQNDYEDNGEQNTDDQQTEIIFARPNTEGFISSGIKIDYVSNEDESDLDVEIEDDDFDLGDIDFDDVEYTPVIQKFGSQADGKNRVVNVNNTENGIEYEGFTGVSCNVFPTQTSLFAQQNGKNAEAFLELNGKRFNDSSPNYARTWFQIDWMITQESGNHTDDLSWKEYKENNNWEENPDYINYYNGVYCFSKGQKMNDEFQAFIDYSKMLDEANVEIYLAFGWKIASRIEAWFGCDPIQSRTSAPLDLDAYADAAVAIFKYMRNDVGLENFNVLSFYNEPNRTNDHNFYLESDFSTIGDKGVYWAVMARKCKDAFAADPELKDVKLMGADLSSDIDVSSDNYVNPYLRNHASDLVDVYTMHYYGYYTESYSELFDRCVFISNFYNKPAMITETFAAEYDVSSDQPSFVWNDWGRSISSAYIACANTGLVGVFRWFYVGDVLYDPIGYDLQDKDLSSWLRPVDVASSNEVKHAYYEDSMLNQYVPQYANVYNIDWQGDDLRVSAFTSEDGDDFALVVEANENKTARNLRVNLKKSLGGKTLYVYKYDHSQEVNGNAIIPQSENVISSVNKNFEYKLGKEYALYVFSTIAPVKQVALFDSETGDPVAAVNCKINGSVTVDARLLDCEDGDTLDWEIKRYSGAVKTKKKVELRRENCVETGTYLEKGSISKISSNTLSITYTATDKAEKGEVVAIRCTIKDGDNNVKNDRYAVLMVVIN